MPTPMHKEEKTFSKILFGLVTLSNDKIRGKMA